MTNADGCIVYGVLKERRLLFSLEGHPRLFATEAQARAAIDSQPPKGGHWSKRESAWRANCVIVPVTLKWSIPR